MDVKEWCEKLFAPANRSIYEVVKSSRLKRLTKSWEIAPLSPGEKAEVRRILKEEFQSIAQTLGVDEQGQRINNARFLP